MKCGQTVAFFAHQIPEDKMKLPNNIQTNKQTNKQTNMHHTHDNTRTSRTAVMRRLLTDIQGGQLTFENKFTEFSRSVLDVSQEYVAWQRSKEEGYPTDINKKHHTSQEINHLTIIINCQIHEEIQEFSTISRSENEFQEVP